MNKVLKKCITIMTTIGIISSCVIGCGNSGTSNSAEAKGRYVEKKIDLPQEATSQFIFQMEKSSEGYPVLYAYSEKEKCVFKYTLNAEGKWNKGNVEWLKNIEISNSSDVYSTEIFKDENGEEYFRYENEEEVLETDMHILKKNADNKAEDFSMDEWKENGCPHIEILKNGNLLCTGLKGELTLYEKGTNKKLFEKDDPELIPMGSNVTAYKDGFVCFTGDGKSQNVKYLSIYDSSGKESKKIEVEQSENLEINDVCIDENNTITICNKKGIHRLNNENSTWETLIDGDLTMLGSPTMYESNFIKGNNDSYYIFYESEDGPELMNYYYDKNVASYPEKEISVYSLENNDTLKEAISIFQRNNPDVKVNFRFSMEKHSDDTKTDYIKTLNTEILSGNGPDIIVLDNLPIDSYIEKGALEDISDVIKPMEKSLLPNVIKNCKKEGKIYSIPSKIGINVIYGNKDIVNNAKTLKDLKKCSEKNKGQDLFGTITYSDLLNNLLPSEVSSFYDKNNNINKDKLKKYLEDIKTIGDNVNCKIEYSEDEFDASNEEDLASKSKIYFENTVATPAFPLAMVKYLHGSFTSYENSYTPLVQVGINSSSKNKDICKEFIKTLLCEDLQNKEITYDGFPVNINSLKKWVNKEYDDFYCETDIETADGKTIPFVAGWPDKDQYEKIEQICLNADKECINDEVVANAIKKQSKEFFNGNITSDKAADNIIQELKMYLSEKN